MSALLMEDLLSLLDEPNTPVCYNQNVGDICWKAVREAFRQCFVVQAIRRTDRGIVEAFEAACVLCAADKSQSNRVLGERAWAQLLLILEPHLRGMADTMSSLTGEALLEATMIHWTCYQASYSIMRDVLRKLGFSQPYKRFLGLWVKWVIDDKYKVSFLKLISDCRCGNKIDANLVKSVNAMLREVGLYDSVFERPTLTDIEAHFDQEARHYINKLDLLSYVRHVRQVMDVQQQQWSQLCIRHEKRPGEKIQSIAMSVMISRHREILEPSLTGALRELLDSAGVCQDFFCVYDVFREVDWGLKLMLDSFSAHLRATISRCVQTDNPEWVENSLQVLQNLWARYGKIIVTCFSENAQLWSALFKEISAVVEGNDGRGQKIAGGGNFILRILRTHPSLQEDHWGRCLPDDLIRQIAEHASRPYKRACSPWCPIPVDPPTLRVAARMVNSDWCRAMSLA